MGIDLAGAYSLSHNATSVGLYMLRTTFMPAIGIVMEFRDYLVDTLRIGGSDVRRFVGRQ